VKISRASALKKLTVVIRLDSSHSPMASSSPPPVSILPTDNAIRSQFFNLLANFNSFPNADKAMHMHILIYKLYTSEPQEDARSSHCLLLWMRVMLKA
ncbi:hypothetical protein PFISCL1PPCAC_23388, partial [Pristionchus fissidentatus]